MHVEAIDFWGASPRKEHRTKSYPSNPHLPLGAPVVPQSHKNKSSWAPLLRRPWKQGGWKSFRVAGQPPPTLISFQEYPPLSQGIGISLPCDPKLCFARVEKDKGCNWTAFCPNVTLPRRLSEVQGGLGGLGEIMCCPALSRCLWAACLVVLSGRKLLGDLHHHPLSPCWGFCVLRTLGKQGPLLDTFTWAPLHPPQPYPVSGVIPRSQRIKLRLWGDKWFPHITQPVKGMAETQHFTLSCASGPITPYRASIRGGWFLSFTLIILEIF